MSDFSTGGLVSGGMSKTYEFIVEFTQCLDAD